MKPSSEHLVFSEALTRATPGARAAYLDEACAGDPDLRRRIEALLRAAESAGDFLEELPTGLAGKPDFSGPMNGTREQAGDRIGRYKLLEQIGEGGCGVVYMAEQEEPVRRRVALKVIKLGMDTRQVIARFEAERQALAMMDHPNIAKVLDAGATESGRPYFVMELVRGIRITDYCDQNNLSTEERLKLFTQVCQAIQHAHQKGIIHRDIKPSNILVTRDEAAAVPKVIDFGIAKATTDQQLTDKSLFTAFEQFIGTPAYMSPEQAMMTSLDIDTRTDIYALGVLLYELLTGRTPFDAKELMSCGLDAIRRIIREQEPVRPSTRLSTMLAIDLTEVASHRHCEPGKLGGLLRGDLDWIVMKALEKDRTRRYETASGLAIDIQRHLSNEPVTARPPSNLYRFQKLFRRQKLPIAAAASVAAAMIIGCGISTWMFFKEKQARQRAVAAEQEQTRLREHAEAEVAEGRRIAKFLGTLAESLRGEQNLTNSESAYRESLALWRRLPGDANKEVNAALNSLTQVLQQQGKLAEAGMTAREAAEKAHNALADHEKMALDDDRQQECWSFAIAYEGLGQLFQSLGQTEEAGQAYRDTQVLWQKLVSQSNLEDHRWHLAINHDLLGNLLAASGRPKEAMESYREAQSVWFKLVTDFNTEDRRYHLGCTDEAIGRLLTKAGRFAEATEVYRQALAVWEKLVAEFDRPDHRIHLSWTIVNLAEILQATGEQAEAELVLREAESACRADLLKKKKLFGDVHREIEGSLGALANILQRRQKLSEAAAVWREELAMERKLSGDEHLFVANSLMALGRVLVAQKHQVAAEAAYREALTLRRKLLGNEHLDTLAALTSLASVLESQEKLGEAENLYREHLAIKKRLSGNEHPDVGVALARLTTTLLAENKFAEAESVARECLKIRQLTFPEDWRTFNVLSLLGGSLLGQKKYAEAEPLLLAGYQGMKQREDRISAGNPNPKTALERLVQLYQQTDRPAELAEWKRQLAAFNEAAAAKPSVTPKP